MTEEKPPTPERDTVQPQGDALDWTDADIDRLANLTPAKIADAKADARRFPLLDALLRAGGIWDGPQA